MDRSFSGASEGFESRARAFLVAREMSFIGRTGLGAPSRKSTFPNAQELGLLLFFKEDIALLDINSSDIPMSREDRVKPVQLVVDDLDWLEGRNPWEAGISIEKRLVSAQLVVDDLD